MLIWQRLKNTLTQMGYARAAANLAQQGLYDQARILMLEKAKLSNTRKATIIRLEKYRNKKASYEPGDHYMRGKSVATWKGKAHA